MVLLHINQREAGRRGRSQGVNLIAVDVNFKIFSLVGIVESALESEALKCLNWVSNAVGSPKCRSLTIFASDLWSQDSERVDQF